MFDLRPIRVLVGMFSLIRPVNVQWDSGADGFTPVTPSGAGMKRRQRCVRLYQLLYIACALSHPP